VPISVTPINAPHREALQSWRICSALIFIAACALFYWAAGLND
jgi:hypothetical protein